VIVRAMLLHAIAISAGLARAAPAAHAAATASTPACTTDREALDGIVASARELVASRDSAERAALRRWGVAEVDPKSVRRISDAAACRRAIDGLRRFGARGITQVAVAGTRGAYFVHATPDGGVTYVLDARFRVVDVLVVPS
jgi:hypothetical protein